MKKIQRTCSCEHCRANNEPPVDRYVAEQAVTWERPSAAQKVQLLSLLVEAMEGEQSIFGQGFFPIFKTQEEAELFEKLMAEDHGVHESILKTMGGADR